MFSAACALALACVSSVAAETYTPQPTQPPFPAPSGQAPQLPPPQPAAGRYEALVGPIALYPDPLIGLILPASSVPADVRAAAVYMIQYGDSTRIDQQPWDPSVRGLAHYPTILAWMAANMDWTEALGNAFVSSQAEVLDAIQSLRARALASGVLVSTPQQSVYVRGGRIEIYPAQPDSVYVPAYDDSVVYSSDPYDGYAGPFINFGDPCPAGPWLSFYFDWGQHQIWSGDPGVWRKHRGWQPPPSGGGRPPPGSHRWNPPGRGPSATEPNHSFHGNGVPLPQPMPGTPKAPPSGSRRPGAVPEPSTSRVSIAGAAAPAATQPRPVAVRDNPAPPRTYAPQPARSNESYPSHSEPARASAPAPAPAPAPANNSGSQQPQR
jgi:hypothetical protein